MADVSVISSSIVKSCNMINPQPGQEKIHLTPSDLNVLFTEYTQRGLIFRKPDPETQFISRLMTSLSTALEIYFPLAGRLVKVNNHEDETVSFYIDCKEGLGARFIHAVAESVSVDDLLLQSVPDFFKSFFPVNGLKSIDGVSEPLLALQITEMKDGVFISFGYNHMVADGTSIWNFFHAWSKICSNGNSVSDLQLQPLLLRGWFLDGINYPIHIPVSETESPPIRELVSPMMPITEESVFHFSKKISHLKAKANREISSSDLKISSLQAVLAHLWRSMARHSGQNLEEESHCRVAADMRQRLNPPIEKECFGNVVHLGIATATVGELQDHGLGWAALQISNMVKSLTNESCITSAENWVRNVKIPKFGVRSSRMVISGSLTVTSSPWFQVYDNDFGWGKPIAARSGPNNDVGGKLVLFRGIQEGSIDVHATLWSGVLLNLLTDVEFLDP